MKSILELLKEIRPEFDFSNDYNLIKDGILDSFDLITLVAAIEEEYAIKIDGSDIIPENFESIKAIEKLISKHGVYGV